MKNFLISITLLALLGLMAPAMATNNIPWSTVDSNHTLHNPTAGAECGPDDFLQFSQGSGRIDLCLDGVFVERSYPVTSSADPQICFDDTGGDAVQDVCLQAVCVGTTCDYQIVMEVSDTATTVLFIDGTLNGKITALNESCAKIENLTDDAEDGYEIFSSSQAFTVLKLGCHCAEGTCSGTLASLILEDRAGTDMTGSPTCSVTTGNSTYATVSGSNTVAAGEGIAIVNSASMTEQDNNYLICFSWVKTP